MLFLPVRGRSQSCALHKRNALPHSSCFLQGRNAARHAWGGQRTEYPKTGGLSWQPCRALLSSRLSNISCKESQPLSFLRILIFNHILAKQRRAKRKTHPGQVCTQFLRLALKFWVFLFVFSLLPPSEQMRFKNAEITLYIVPLFTLESPLQNHFPFA